jgi:Putative zinc finger in N-recognin (UBR box)
MDSNLIDVDVVGRDETMDFIGSYNKKKRSATTTATSCIPEDITFLPEEKQAYDAAYTILTSPDSFFAPFPSLVAVEPVSTVHGTDETSGITTSNDRSAAITDSLDFGPFGTVFPSSTIAESRMGHHVITDYMSRNSQELDRALARLEELEKEEPTLIGKTPVTKHLTEIVTLVDVYQDSSDAVNRLEMLGRAVPRRVCQHPFRKNDIVWVCRTCQADETCVLCHNCFSQSKHEGHDVAFYHAQAGGCCDCGDPDGT